ncbi:MAG: hypothetical protein N2V78_02825, partial [Methanophagales archaeon]|nr:hypothetical protein [Methanophagales archaeon]
MTKMRHFKKGGGWSGLNCVDGRTFTGNSIPGFCEAKKVPFLAQVFFFQTLGKFNQNASQKESV